MSFAWPLALLSLLVAPVLLGAYWWMQRRRRKQAVRYSSVALLRSVLPRRNRWQRHLPVALLLASLVALAVAAGRPHMVRDVPHARTSIVLAMDVSGSMCATDARPNRLAAAQVAAREYVEDQPKGVRMALVVFSGFAELIVPPTTDRKVLADAIESLTVGRGTAIGAAMLKSLDAIAEANPAVAPVGDAAETDAPPARAQPGANGYLPDIVVLLTDGASNRGIEPLNAVPYAVERGVRVYTIGFGTENPMGRSCSRKQLGGRVFEPPGFGGGGGFGGRGGFGGGGWGGGFRRGADIPTLQAVAKQTGGTYHGAQDADQLREVFSGLTEDVATQKRPTEITWIVAALGALLAAGAIAASIRWSPFP
jgi:Ca-activated chloride channel family protein